MTHRQQFLLLAGALVAATYLGAVYAAVPFPAIAIWKAAGIVLFGLFALVNGARLLAAGLFFSAAGDIALVPAIANYPAGMGFFGIAHILYTAAFARRIRLGGICRAGYLPAGLFVLFSLGLLAWFLPDMAELTLPGIFYQLIITLMVVTALLSHAPLLAKSGAVLFAVSDTLIAFGLYKEIAVIPGAVWVTYASAQFLLAYGLVSARSRAAK